MDFTGLIIVPDVEKQAMFEAVPSIEGKLTHIGLLSRGTTNGKASVTFRVVVEGKEVAVQTTWALLQSAVRALQGSPIGEPERI